MYQPAETIMVRPPTSSAPNRFHSPVGAAIRNAKPTTQPVNAIQRIPPVSIARTVKYAATTSSSTSNASGLLYRNISTATGVTASAAPAMRPAPGPLHRLTVKYRTATAATPINAWGSNMVNALKPKSLPDKPITHIAAGGLSTVMALPASSEPNSHAFQLWVPACA